MTDFDSMRAGLVARLRDHSPLPVASGETMRQAAVALVLRENLGLAELLVIKRALAERDHWSGHLALPGGRKDESDASLGFTAVRETHEEVGIDLASGGELLGELKTIRPESPFAPKILVMPFVAIAPSEYHVLDPEDEQRPLILNREVAEAFWVPLAHLKERGRSEVFRMMVEGGERSWPAYTTEQGLIWGITERILTNFLELVEQREAS